MADARTIVRALAVALRFAASIHGFEAVGFALDATIEARWWFPSVEHWNHWQPGLQSGLRLHSVAMYCRHLPLFGFFVSLHYSKKKKKFKSSLWIMILYIGLKNDNLPQAQVSDRLDDVITHVLHLSVFVLYVAVWGCCEVLSIWRASKVVHHDVLTLRDLWSELILGVAALHHIVVGGGA